MAVPVSKAELGCRLTGFERLLPWQQSVIVDHFSVLRRP
jgi:hypothetical protein